MPANTLETEVAEAIGAVVDQVVDLQEPSGRWPGMLCSSAAGTGPALIALHVADPWRNGERIRRGAAWLRAHQADDGGWGDRPGEPSTLFATAVAVTALHLTEPEASEAVVGRALAWFDRTASWAALRTARGSALRICAYYLASAGLLERPNLPSTPVELVYFGRLLPTRLSLGLATYLAWSAAAAQRETGGGRLRRAIRAHAVERALTAVRRLQGDERCSADNPPGGFLESVVTTSFVCTPLSQTGLAGDVVRRGIAYLCEAQRSDGSWPVNRQIDFSVTALITEGLLEAGATDTRQMRRAVCWIRSCQQDQDLPLLRVPSGGWAWSQPSGVADPEDTGFALRVLLGSGVAREDATVVRGVRWLRDTQGSAGAWGIVRNAKRYQDSACSYFTAGAVNALHAAGVVATDKAVVRALAWFARVQRLDGSVPCAWYRDSTAGTAATLETFGLLGLLGSQVARRALSWLLAAQRADGGWANGDRAFESTVEETSWALLALLETGLPELQPAVRRGVRWLLDARGHDGLWPAAVIGTYVKGTVHYAEDLFPVAFALRALGRYRRRYMS